MAADEFEGQYFVYEARLASFHGPQPVSKRRVSTANSRAPKTLTWPHKTPNAVAVGHPSPQSSALSCFADSGRSSSPMPASTSTRIRATRTMCAAFYATRRWTAGKRTMTRWPST